MERVAIQLEGMLKVAIHQREDFPQDHVVEISREPLGHQRSSNIQLRSINGQPKKLEETLYFLVGNSFLLHC